MSTGMEMQRLSRGAEGASRDVGFTGSPGEKNAQYPALRPIGLKLGLEREKQKGPGEDGFKPVTLGSVSKGIKSSGPWTHMVEREH